MSIDEQSANLRFLRMVRKLTAKLQGGKHLPPRVKGIRSGLIAPAPEMLHKENADRTEKFF